MSAIELKPFCKEAEVAIVNGDLILTLTIDFAVIDRLEGIFRPKMMPELITQCLTSVSMMIKFAWQMTRKHHADLTLDQIAGVVLSEDGAAVEAVLGALLKDTFNIGDIGEGEESRPPRKRSAGASRASSRSGSRRASARPTSGGKRPARS